MEALVLLMLSVALLWVSLPLILVNIGWMKVPEVARTQPILVQPSSLTSGETDDEVTKLPSIESHLDKPTLPDSLEKITQGSSLISPPKPDPVRE